MGKVCRLRIVVHDGSQCRIEIFCILQVGTQGTLKGITPDQLEELGCEIILGNTYHLGHRPVNLVASTHLCSMLVRRLFISAR